jgi:hypothetical protein
MDEIKIFDATGRYVYEEQEGQQKGKLYFQGQRFGGTLNDWNGLGHPQDDRAILGLVDKQTKKLFLMKLPMYDERQKEFLYSVFWSLSPTGEPISENVFSRYQGLWCFAEVKNHQELVERSRLGFTSDWFRGLSEDDFRRDYFPNPEECFKEIERRGRLYEQTGELELKAS